MEANWKLLIVEDEVGIAHLIKNSIDFDKLSLELCGIAGNGKVGLEMIHSLKPDIVVTDIYMPVMNGVDMITQAADEGNEAQFIIISGLTQFKYAMSALNAGVCGYLLKPLNKEELNILLEKTIQKIAKSRKVEYQLNIMESKIDEQRKELRNAYLFNLLHFRESAVGDVDQINRNHGFSFSDDGVYMVCVLLIDGIKSMNYAASKTIIEQLSTELYLRIHPICIDMEMYLRGNGFVLLINYDKDNSMKFQGLLTNEFAIIRQKFENQTDVEVSMACSANTGKLSEIAGALDAALDTLQARIVLGSEKILFADKLEALKPERACKLTEKESTYLISAIDIKEKERVKIILGGIYAKAIKASVKYPCYIFDTLSELTFDICSVLYRNNIIDSLTNKANILYRNTISQMGNGPDIVEYSVSYIMGMLPELDPNNRKKGETAANIRKYLDEHLSEQLRLEDVAEAFHLSPSYFGTVFKNEIGESFSSYLQSARINRAKELLISTNDTIDAIAGKCGYLDRKHFSKLFNSVVGVKPNEYRKINR